MTCVCAGWVQSVKPTQSLSSLDRTELPSPLTSGLLFPCLAEMIEPSLPPSFPPNPPFFPSVLPGWDKWEVKKKKASFCYLHKDCLIVWKCYIERWAAGEKRAKVHSEEECLSFSAWPTGKFSDLLQTSLRSRSELTSGSPHSMQSVQVLKHKWKICVYYSTIVGSEIHRLVSSVIC